MKNKNQICKDLLKYHQTGLTLTEGIKSIKNIFIGRIIFLLILFLVQEYIFMEYILLAAGIIIGCFLQDISWLYQISKKWPLTNEITDWKKVAEIANS